MNRSSNNLREFAEHVAKVPTNELSERIVRLMIEKSAKSCDIKLLVMLGQCLVDYRKSELQRDAEQN